MFVHWLQAGAEEEELRGSGGGGREKEEFSREFGAPLGSAWKSSYARGRCYAAALAAAIREQSTSFEVRSGGLWWSRMVQYVTYTCHTASLLLSVTPDTTLAHRHNCQPYSLLAVIERTFTRSNAVRANI